MNKAKPSGFIATCQCGSVVGAMDYERTDRKDAARMLGEWLMAGCTVTPQLRHNWSVTVESCRCDREEPK
jgi:hypothetical protein